MKYKKTEDNRGGDAPGDNRAITHPASTRPHPHPHDRIFREIFAATDAQQDLVMMALPPEITSRFRLETIRDAGQESAGGRADLVLTVETIDNTTEYVYVLVEHKSRTTAPMVAVQLMGYVAEIMKRHVKPPVPIVHPLVFYHGREKWTVPTELTGASHAGVRPHQSTTRSTSGITYLIWQPDTAATDRRPDTHTGVHAGMIIDEVRAQAAKLEAARPSRIDCDGWLYAV